MSSLKWAFLDFKVSVFWLLCLIIFYGSISLTVWSLFLTLYAYIFVNFIFQHFLLELYNNCLHQKYYSISLPKTFLLGFSSTTTICHTYLWNKIILLPLLLLQKIILQLKCYSFFFTFPLHDSFYPNISIVFICINIPAASGYRV